MCSCSTNIKQRIHDHAIQNLNCSIRECSLKLEFFQNVFKINERPAYTDICKFKEDRSTLCCYVKCWLEWISLGHAFIHKIDNDIEKFWWIAVQ
jgi:hypothetical protein